MHCRLKPIGAVVLTLLTFLCTGCDSPQVQSNGKPHHTGLGFRNNYPHPDKPSFWKWQWTRWTQGVPSDPEAGYAFPMHRPDLVFLSANRTEPTLTWIGHATFLLQLGGVNILTDPHFTQRASPVSFAGPRRHTPLPLEIAELPPVDVVVISHNHYDHLDLPTVKALNRQAGNPPLFLVPLGQRAWFASQGITRVTELDWWESIAHQGLNFHLAPVQHWSKRTLWDTNETLWGSWVIEHSRMRVLFGGDFGYSKDLADIAKRFTRFDLALLPIGAYEPRWFMSIMHVNPKEAVQAHRDLKARHSIGMHWGTFRLTDETLDDPPKKLAEALSDAGLSRDDFSVMAHGETRRLRFDSAY